MAIRRIQKSCPGCGAKNCYRKADEVCHDCRHAIDGWKKYVSDFGQRKDLAVVLLKGASHWYPKFYGSGPSCHPEGFSETRDELGNLFADLGAKLCVARFEWSDIPQTERADALCLFFKPDVRYPKQPDKHYAERAQYPSSDGSSGTDDYGKIDAAILELLRKLWDRTARFAEMAYLGGVQDGQSLLSQLAAGELSPSELAERDVMLAKKMQDSAYIHRKLRKRKIEQFA